jgi:hypothetical protein
MLVAMIAGALAQTPFDDGLAVEGRHLTALAGWSGANLIGGTTGALLADDPRWRSFHATNAAWNTVNLGIAVAGAVGLARKQRAGDPGPEALLRAHRGLRTALGVNLALDGVYVGSGVALAVHGGRLRELDLRGVGLSLVLQGAFLAVFDAHFLLSHRHRTR